MLDDDNTSTSIEDGGASATESIPGPPSAAAAESIAQNEAARTGEGAGSSAEAAPAKKTAKRAPRKTAAKRTTKKAAASSATPAPEGAESADAVTQPSANRGVEPAAL